MIILGLPAGWQFGRCFGAPLRGGAAQTNHKAAGDVGVLNGVIMAVGRLVYSTPFPLWAIPAKYPPCYNLND